MKVESRDFRFYRGGVKSQRIKERPKRKKGKRTEEQKTEDIVPSVEEQRRSRIKTKF